MKFKKFVFLILFFNLYFINVNAENKIVFLDIDYVIKNTSIGKKILNDLNQINETNIKKLKKKETELKDIETNITSKKNLISEEEYNNEILTLSKKIQVFKEEKNKMVNDFNKKKDSEFINLLNKINPLIKKFMSDNEIDVVLDKKNIIIGSINSDITNDLIDLINKNLK
tara:strand:- start:1090 stop:1599 length:510 start_codon:yes stop_codon:yes gene_type:complete